MSGHDGNDEAVSYPSWPTKNLKDNGVSVLQ
jgi:hypothetical protein